MDTVINIAKVILIAATVYYVIIFIKDFLHNIGNDILGALNSIERFLQHLIGNCGTCNSDVYETKTGTYVTSSETPCNWYTKSIGNLGCWAFVGLGAIILAYLVKALYFILNKGKTDTAKELESTTGKTFSQISKEINDKVNEDIKNADFESQRDYLKDRAAIIHFGGDPTSTDTAEIIKEANIRSQPDFKDYKNSVVVTDDMVRRSLQTWAWTRNVVGTFKKAGASIANATSKALNLFKTSVRNADQLKEIEMVTQHGDAAQPRANPDSGIDRAEK